MNQQNHMIEPEELMAYLDGELSPARAADTAAHLRQCKECQDRVAELDELSKRLLVWETETSNSVIPNVIVEALDEREKRGIAGGPKVPPSVQWIWTWLKNPKTFRQRGWQLAGVGVLALVIAMLSIPNLLRSRAPTQNFLSKEQARHPEVVSNYTDQNAIGKVPPIAGLRARLIPPPPPPAPTPAPGVSRSDSELRDQVEGEDDTKPEDDVSQGPMVVRSAQLTVTMKDFDLARKSVDDILKRYHGYLGDLTVNTPNGSARSIDAKLRIPSAQLDAALAALKVLGRVEAEAQNGEEVTQQYVDLNARLSNARKTKQRLIEIQRDRTGKLSDVLSVELQIGRVQGEIEQMEAQLKTMKNKISFALLELTITEQYKAELKVVPPSLGDQLRNAGIDGVRAIRDTVVLVLFWVLSTGPILLFWTLILFYPGRLIWKKIRPRLVPNG